MESLARQVTKQDTKKDKRKDKEKEAKNQTDGTELSEVKVEVASNHTNQHSQVNIVYSCDFGSVSKHNKLSPTLQRTSVYGQVTLSQKTRIPAMSGPIVRVPTQYGAQHCLCVFEFLVSSAQYYF